MNEKYNADIGIIGGTGVYDSGLFSDKKEVKVYTPFGDPSDLVTIGEYAGRKIAFIPRHGRGHRIPPHKINYRANIWTFKQLGVKRIIAPSAVGSLKKEYKPGDIVIPDQFVDLTKSRSCTFYEGGQVCHISVADPFCPELRRTAISKISNLGITMHQKGTYVCIEGPRFSTRAESLFFKESVKAELIGMTLVPECPLAREAEICYISLSTITDYDVWADIPVSSREVMEILNKNVERTRKIISELIPEISVEKFECDCRHSLEGAIM